MVMATCRAVVRSITGTVDDPAEVMRRVNARLSGDITPGMFVTCFYGVLDPATGTLSFANAGHTLPVLKTGGGRSEELRATGMPFGWMPDAGYDTVVRNLPSGSVIVIPSDGVIEARDPAGEFWGWRGSCLPSPVQTDPRSSTRSLRRFDCTAPRRSISATTSRCSRWRG